MRAGLLNRWLPATAAAAALIAAAAATTGCGISPARVALPTKPVHAARAAGVSAQLTAKQLVITAYEGYWQATSQALDSRSPARARVILAQYVPASAVPAIVRGLRAIWRQGEIGYGGPVFHIMKVTFRGTSSAAVHDCIDMSHTGFQNARTGEIVGGLGQAHDYLITTLVRVGGRWLVTGAIPVVRPC
jgi:hypothetical protein